MAEMLSDSQSAVRVMTEPNALHNVLCYEERSARSTSAGLGQIDHRLWVNSLEAMACTVGGWKAWRGGEMGRCGDDARTLCS